MTEELATQEPRLPKLWQDDGSIMLPLTGELVDEGSSVESLASALKELAGVAGEYFRAKRTVEAWVVARAEHEATNTLRPERAPEPPADSRDLPAVRPAARPTITIKGSGYERVYPGERLAAMLSEWVREGKISQGAADRACKTVIEYRPMLRGIDAIAKKHPDLKAYLDALEDRQEKRQTVTVS